MQKKFTLLLVLTGLFLTGCTQSPPSAAEQPLLENPCYLQTALVGMQLKSAIQQAVHGETAVLSTTHPPNCEMNLQLKTVSDPQQCKGTCNQLISECLQIGIEETEGGSCIENTPIFTDFSADCPPVEKMRIVSLQPTVPQGILVIIRTNDKTSPRPKICVYQNNGLSAAEIQTTFMPPKMKWLAEKIQQEQTALYKQNFQQAVQRWTAQPHNRVVLPEGSENKTWTEVLEAFQATQYNSINLRGMRSGQKTLYGQYEGMQVSYRNEEKNAPTATIKTTAACGPENPAGCIPYTLQISYSQAEDIPAFIVQLLETHQQLEWPLYPQQFEIEMNDNQIQQLAQLVKDSQ